MQNQNSKLKSDLKHRACRYSIRIPLERDRRISKYVRFKHLDYEREEIAFRFEIVVFSFWLQVFNFQVIGEN